MPNFNKLGPNGEGPRTGRRNGVCDENKNVVPAIKGRQERPRRGIGNNRKLDGTGPNGEGPRTGKGSGICDEVRNIKKSE